MQQAGHPVRVSGHQHNSKCLLQTFRGLLSDFAYQEGFKKEAAFQQGLKGGEEFQQVWVAGCLRAGERGLKEGGIDNRARHGQKVFRGPRMGAKGKRCKVTSGGRWLSQTSV